MQKAVDGGGRAALAKHARDPQGFYSMPFDNLHVAYTLVKVPAPPPQMLLQDTTPLPSQLTSPGSGAGGGGGGSDGSQRFQQGGQVLPRVVFGCIVSVEEVPTTEAGGLTLLLHHFISSSTSFPLCLHSTMSLPVTRCHAV